MIVYCGTSLKVEKAYKQLQEKRTSNANPANLLSCPAVRDGWHNVFMFSIKSSFSVKHVTDFVERSDEGQVTRGRLPHFEDTNIFNIIEPTYLFAEIPLKIKVTAPYFHKVEFQKEATFVGGKFDIGRWFRPIEAEIITWAKSGEVQFNEGEPLFYVEFLTDLPIEIKHFVVNPIIEHLSSGLVNSPFQNSDGLQGSLESRYQAFENSDYRRGLLEEIKAAVVDKVD